MPDAAPDVELVEPVAVPVVFEFELVLEVLDEEELVAEGDALELGAGAPEDGELCPL